jgi:two-component system chemotaxis response regulator CheY
LKAIIVDDSRAIRMVLKKTLSEAGFDVVEAGDGRQALDQLTASGPLDLALVDWNMPVMTGFELVHELRAKPSFKGMAILMVSTETESAQVQRAIAAGANEYLLKPFTPETVREKLAVLGFAKA